MALELVLIKPTVAFAEKYSRMFKNFSREYEGTTTDIPKQKKEMIQIALEDMRQEYLFWIVLDGKRIGFVSAPYTWKQDGTITGRYLDTRYILPEYRAKGLGTQVLKLLLEQHTVDSAKINTVHLTQTSKFWPKFGFRYAVPAFAVDKNFAIEKNRELFDENYRHWYLLHNDSASLKILQSEGAPLLDLLKENIEETQ